MPDRATIMAVDDDKATQTVVKDFLEEQGYRVVTSTHGEELSKVLNSSNPDLVLLDVVLPDKDGLPLIHEIKDKHPIPVIVISDKDTTIDKVVGLEMGADDYLGKPFELHELAARIKASLRLVEMVEESVVEDKKDESLIQFGSWVLDRKRMQLLDKHNKPAGLTTGEFQLLEALILSAGQVLSREQLYDMTHDRGELEAFDRAIDIQIGRIRKKLGDDPDAPQYIKTVRGAGYMFIAQTKAQT